mgnify:CR=1 FL=1
MTISWVKSVDADVTITTVLGDDQLKDFTLSDMKKSKIFIACDTTNINKIKKTKNYNYDYSISLWFFLHSNNQKWKVKNKWKNILNYDKRPHIVYNIQTNTLEVRVKTGTESTEKVIFKKKHFPLQKWHNIVVNYTNGVVDIFLNSKLIATDSQILPLMKHSNLILGEKGGVQGGVTNVIYFPAHMSRTRIETNYRLLRDNPRKVP